ncbi:abc transporter [Lucifera butyrica]|uniref:Abc transporter n=1 Tax=Lucifera butyrica TaxID=1351585 RepID=A0A498R6G2_9FIRM|nr:ABC transporter ATP-binding protein [Lucifera butyrica]VBB06779.1 abc transporter [Lucifera butyrica]
MPAITFDHFSYAYQHPRKVLDNITLSVDPGSFNVVIGPSGAGKTTLCLAVAGAVPHYFGGSIAGQVLVDGTATTASAMHHLARSVGTVLQDYETQLVTMTVEEEVSFSLENQGVQPAKIECAVKEALTRVGLAGMEKREVASLSGGQKQRLVLASVLATNPHILVLDEPASALDPEGAAMLYSLLGDLNRRQGITLLVVEHDIARVLPYANRFLLLENGELRCTGTAGDVLAFMYEQGVFAEAVPPLWQLKMALEKATGRRFEPWRTEQEAVVQLSQCLPKEVVKSA